VLRDCVGGFGCLLGWFYVGVELLFGTLCCCLVRWRVLVVL